MQALLQAHFPDCLQPGTSVRERGLTVSIERSKDETIQFYCTDCDHTHNKLYTLTDEKTCCDYAVLYAKSIQNNEKELLCFLELKGCDFDHAVAQVSNIYKYITELWQNQIKKELHQYVVPCVSICMHGRAPSPLKGKRGRDLLLRLFKNHDCIRVKHGVSHDKELGQFLRKLYDK